MPQLLRVCALLGVLTCVAAAMLSCGNGLPHSGDVIASITPAQASIRIGENVALTGNATGFTEAPIVRWWIQEAHDSGSGDDCGYLTLPAMSPCPYGYVVFGSVTRFPSPATYYAPSTTGTYHVTFEAIQSSEYDYLSKTVTATITVTP
jgi:hypothetical protein